MFGKPNKRKETYYLYFNIGSSPFPFLFKNNENIGNSEQKLKEISVFVQIYYFGNTCFSLE